MNSAREEILRLSTERLRNKVESIMFNINMILTSPESCDNQVGKISELIVELAVAESAMKISQGLLTQVLTSKLQELESLIENPTKPPVE